MSDSNEPTSTIAIGGQQATAVRFERYKDSLDLSFVRDDRVIETVTGVQSPDEMMRLVGVVNSARIYRGGERGELSGKTLRSFESASDRASTTKSGDWVETGIPPDEAETNIVEPISIPLAMRIPIAMRASVETSKDAEPRQPAQAGASPAAAQPAAPDVATPDEEAQRRAAAFEQVQAQFDVRNDRYRFKDGSRALAFREHESKLVSASSDVRAARAMATMADSRGWEAIKASGHADFKRAVWIEATARGLEVRGHTPSEQDRQASEERAAELPVKNQVAEAKPVRSDRATVLESVSSKLIDERVTDPDLRASLKAAIAKELVARERTGALPAVPMYDRSAAPRSTSLSRDPSREAGHERTH